MEQHGKNSNDIDCKNFDADRFVNSLVKETTLRQLIDKEKELVREIQSLDSEMQTLVYENYNKFILATDTIRQMKSDFKAMEDEMGKLVAEMSEISSFSNNISQNLQDRHQKISQLSNTNELLRSLQFLFDLPKTLKQCLDEGNFEMAVSCYIRSEKVLKDFGDHPSFKGIQADCNSTLSALKEELWKEFRNAELASSDVEKVAKLLCKLGEPSSALEDEYLEISRCRLEKDLRDFEFSQLTDQSGHISVEVIVEKCCNSCLNNIAITIATFNNVFSDSTKRRIMCEIGAKIMEELCHVVEKKLLEATGSTIDEPFCLAVAGAVDKFNRRFIAVQRLLDADIQMNCAVPQNVVDKISQHTAEILHEDWTKLLNQLVSSWNETSTDSFKPLDSVKGIEASLVESVQRALVALTAFLEQHLTFSQDARYRRTTGLLVRERIVVNSVKNLLIYLSEIGFQSGKNVVSPTLMLILSRVAMDFHQTLVHSLLALVDEQFEVPSSSQQKLAPTISAVVQECKTVSQSLLQKYVRSESHVIVQMIRKSMDSREWLSASEPRSVRPAVKRVLEEISRVDSLAAQLYEDGVKREKGSDSSRRTHSIRLPQKSSWSSLGPSQIDSSLLNNIQKLFSERIDLSGTIDPTKSSIVLALIKICLKGFLECARLKTFGRYGVQQIQVDCFYLQLFLWRFTPDENLIHGLLDEILSSALQRCLEPILMDAGVVELICER